MSFLSLEHDEILDECSRRRDARHARYLMGNQAIDVRSFWVLGKAVVEWIRETWDLRDCANGFHPQARVIHRKTFDLGDGTERVCRMCRCDKCGETWNHDRVRPVLGGMKNGLSESTPSPQALRPKSKQS